MMPALLISPTVGLMPTIPQVEAGQTMEPSVSEPMATSQRLAEIAAPEPELDPQGFRSNTYGFLVCPPRPLHPLTEWVERKLAHSLRFVFPRITAPAARKRSATEASRPAGLPTSAREPAVVCIRSAVSMLSFSRTGTPCSGPRGPFARYSASSERAIAVASGFISMTDRSAGPRWSSCSMRRWYSSAMLWTVCEPCFRCVCRSEIDISSSSNACMCSLSLGAAELNDEAAVATLVARNWRRYMQSHPQSTMPDVAFRLKIVDASSN